MQTKKARASPEAIEMVKRAPEDCPGVEPAESLPPRRPDGFAQVNGMLGQARSVVKKDLDARPAARAVGDYT